MAELNHPASHLNYERIRLSRDITLLSVHCCTDTGPVDGHCDRFVYKANTLSINIIQKLGDGGI